MPGILGKSLKQKFFQSKVSVEAKKSQQLMRALITISGMFPEDENRNNSPRLMYVDDIMIEVKAIKDIILANPKHFSKAKSKTEALLKIVADHRKGFCEILTQKETEFFEKTLLPHELDKCHDIMKKSTKFVRTLDQIKKGLIEAIKDPDNASRDAGHESRAVRTLVL